MRHTFIVCIIALALQACSTPKARVTGDVAALQQREFGERARIELLDVAAGEGDSDNVYYLIDLVVVAREDVVISQGLFRGLSLSRGKRSAKIRLSFLYQWEDSGWQLTRIASNSTSIADGLK